MKRTFLSFSIKKFLITLGLGISLTSLLAAEFKFVHALEEAYWYSRYNLGSLVMKSNLGETFKPGPEMVEAMVKMVSDEWSTAVPAKNAALLKRVFNGGNPSYINASNNIDNDFNNFRWAPVESSKTSAAAFGWVLMKEIEWVKQFNIDFHFGDPMRVNIPGAQERFAGLVLCAESLMQLKEYQENENLFDFSNIVGQYVALKAIANFSQYLTVKNSFRPFMRENRCALLASMMLGKTAEEISESFLQTAKSLYQKIDRPTTIPELSEAIQSLIWYAYANQADRMAIKTQIIAYGQELAGLKASNPVDQAHMIRALIEIGRVTDSPRYMKLAARQYSEFATSFNSEKGIFNGFFTYNTSDVAVLIGALNSLKLFVAGRVDQEQVENILVKFFDTILNQAGMQISAPPVEKIPPYERRDDSMLHRHPSLPVPALAGGEFGIAPVFASEVSMKSGHWERVNSFDSAGAMQLASEFLWLHHAEVNGFPNIP